MLSHRAIRSSWVILMEHHCRILFKSLFPVFNVLVIVGVHAGKSCWWVGCESAYYNKFFFEMSMSRPGFCLMKLRQNWLRLWCCNIWNISQFFISSRIESSSHSYTFQWARGIPRSIFAHSLWLQNIRIRSTLSVCWRRRYHSCISFCAVVLKAIELFLSTIRDR